MSTVADPTASGVLTPVPADPARSLSLDGPWRVTKWPFAADEASLAAPATDDAGWATMVQPGKVFYADPEGEAQDIPNWNRITLTHIDPEDGAVLRRRVAIPAAWTGKRVVLRFGAIFPAGRVYLDGALLGEYLSAVTPVEYDITDRVRPGSEALVAVRLIRRHRFVQMDMVRHALEFAGLAQSAVVFAVEPCHMADYHLIPDLNATLTQGTVVGAVTVTNRAAAPVEPRLTATLSAADGSPVASQTEVLTLAAGQTGDVPVTLAVDAPALWNDEYPTLYGVTLTLAVPGQPDQQIAYRTGFRRFELRPEGARLNGNPVKFRGVNHLTFHPDHGMHTPKDWLRQNLTLMKRANVNCIRTHFLSPPALVELCDELGIYLMQELPIDWGTDYIHDPEWIPPALARIEAGVRRDRHHVSLMVWSVGNENMPKTAAVADAGWAHLRAFDALVKGLDPSRPTMFPPPGPANAIDGILELRVGDIADTHYSFHHVKRFLRDGEVQNPNSWEADMTTQTREGALASGWSGLWFSSEYGIFNAMPDLLESPWCSIITDVPEDPLSGKSTLAAFTERLEREWGFMRHEASCLGGAYFPWLCSGAGSAEAGNPWGWVRWGEDADWGVVTADLLPKPFFWSLRVLFSPVWFPRKLQWTPGQTSFKIPLWNQYNAIDLADCTLRVQLNTVSRYMTMLRKYTDFPMACAPGAKTEVEIPLNAGQLKALEDGKFVLCRCTLLDPSGFRPITAEIMVLPPGADADAIDTSMPIGPDAAL